MNRLAKHVPAVFLFEWTLRGFISHYMFDYVARSGENTYEFLLLGIALLLVVMGSVIDWARVTLSMCRKHGVSSTSIGWAIGVCTR